MNNIFLIFGEAIYFEEMGIYSAQFKGRDEEIF